LTVEGNGKVLCEFKNLPEHLTYFPAVRFTAPRQRISIYYMKVEYGASLKTAALCREEWAAKQLKLDTSMLRFGSDNNASTTSPNSVALEPIFEKVVGAESLNLSAHCKGISSVNGNHQLAHLQYGLKRGKAIFTFQVTKDIINDERICLGVGVPPFTDFHYESKNLILFRIYNSSLLNQGASTTYTMKQKFKIGDVYQFKIDTG
jgi:hypothetical protein